MTTKTDSPEDPTEIPTVNEDSPGMGDIKINHNVVASIVRLAALEVDGTHSVGNGGFSEGITELFKGKEAASSGVRVAEDEAGDYVIEIRVVLRFGVELANVALSIQQNVKEQVTRMTMKGVAKVDVIIENVRMEADVAEAQRDEYSHNTD